MAFQYVSKSFDLGCVLTNDGRCHWSNRRNTYSTFWKTEYKRRPCSIAATSRYPMQHKSRRVGGIMRGATESIRTTDLLLRREALYPAELRPHGTIVDGWRQSRFERLTFPTLRRDALSRCFAPTNVGELRPHAYNLRSRANVSERCSSRKSRSSFRYWRKKARKATGSTSASQMRKRGKTERRCSI